MFNVVQEITSTVAGFVAVARRQVYRNALSNGTISPDIFQHPQMQGKQLCQNLQRTILTMTAGSYKESIFVFKSYQPQETTKKRTAQTEAAGESLSKNRNRGSSGNGGTGTTAINNRIPRHPASNNSTTQNLLDNSPTPTTIQGNTILKQLETDCCRLDQQSERTSSTLRRFIPPVLTQLMINIPATTTFNALSHELNTTHQCTAQCYITH